MINFFDTLPSTQTELLENIDKYSEFDAIVANMQTAGYGRSGMWDSPQNNLYMSVAISAHEHIFAKCLVSFHIVCTHINSQARIKFPNDIYIDQKKVGGLIIESKGDTFVCGFGLNLNTSNDKYDHISNLPIKNVDVANHLITILKKVVTWSDEELVTYYKRNLGLLNQNVIFIDKKTNKKQSGIVTAIDLNYIKIDNITYHHMQIKLLNK